MAKGLLIGQTCVWLLYSLIFFSLGAPQLFRETAFQRPILSLSSNLLDTPIPRVDTYFQAGLPPHTHGGVAIGAENPVLALVWQDGAMLPSSLPSRVLDQASQTPRCHVAAFRVSFN